jgi:hypothetical protein
MPSTGAGLVCANGSASSSVIEAKKTAKPSRTAVAYGATSRTRRRRANRTRLDHTESSHTHRSREPSCDDQAAVAL